MLTSVDFVIELILHINLFIQVFIIQIFVIFKVEVYGRHHVIGDVLQLTND